MKQNNQNQGNVERKRAAERDRYRNQRDSETPEQSEQRRAIAREKARNRRSLQNQEEAERRRAAARIRYQNLKTLETTDQSERRLAAVAERSRNKRAAETSNQRDLRLAAARDRYKNQRTLETSEQRERRLDTDAERACNQRASESLEQRERRLAANAERTRNQRASKILEQREQTLGAEREHENSLQLFIDQENVQHNTEDNYEIAFRFRQNKIREAEMIIAQHYCGPMNVECFYCKALHFATEKSDANGSFLSCCRHGKFKLPDVPACPDFLRDMFTNPRNLFHSNLRANVRAVNSAVSFASFGANVDRQNYGPQVFKIQGQIYHQTNHLQPQLGQVPKYDQLYFIDGHEATEYRMNEPANENCNREMMHMLDQFIRNNNCYAQLFFNLNEIVERENREAEAQGRDVPNVNITFLRDVRFDQRRYNLPISNEVAVVFVNNDGEPPFERDFRIYYKNPPAAPERIYLNILSQHLEPMCYVLFNIFGCPPGWSPKWNSETYDGVQANRCRNQVTKLQYVSAMLHDRHCRFELRLHAGRLTEQYIVDMYVQIEAAYLKYLRENQTTLRAESYQGLLDFIEGQADNMDFRAGVPVILPSSFQGSARNLRERFVDASAIFQKYGPPDLFITMTANPTWLEITENLWEGEKVSDRPDLVCRVFKLKLKEVLDDVVKKHKYGTVVAYAYSIEFQKRGLPHVHMLFTLATEFKFTTPERIDQVVSAEIPDVQVNPLLHAIVARNMMHGPCGPDNPCNVCMVGGKCSKNFPKDFQDRTVLNTNGYPLYRRTQGATVQVRGSTLDNRYVVPYNPELLLKYNCHINVEVCSSVKAVKYIYKYIYKGYDCAYLVVHSGELELNEIKSFINARYVGSTDAMWRILENEMHGRSHAVIRLPVHLENMQQLIFTAGEEEARVDNPGTTMFMGWFQLNQRDQNARNFFYYEIPYHYTWNQSDHQWNPRKRGGDKIVPRVYLVNLKNEELFYLRMLVFHIRGATSYQDLRTVDGIVHPKFKDAVIALNLLSNDDEWRRCLEEAKYLQMPRQMRDTFAYICVFCSPSNPLELWLSFRNAMSLDYLRNCDQNQAYNYSLHDIEFIFNQHGTSCATYDLPTPVGDSYESTLNMYNPVEEAKFAHSQIALLNSEQKSAHDAVMRAVNDDNEKDRHFFIDGPGGSGKTFLYSTLLATVRSQGHIALPFATTGIASLLLKGGRTVHSGFKLPVPIHDASRSSMRPNSQDANQLKSAKLIIIDEVSMMTKDGMRCIDLLLRDLLNSDVPFGNKVVVVGGDFRQTLPVVPNGSRVEIIEVTVKNSPLWHHFKKISLSQNMRSHGQEHHNEWLLEIGNGAYQRNDSNLPQNSVVIPNEMINDGNLIDAIFGNIEELTDDELAERAILAPTNAEALDINIQVIDRIGQRMNNKDNQPTVYYSADSIMSDDPNDFQNYPMDYLHQQTPPGMPPHVLLLKKGVIVMLIRNLNPRKGLCNGTRLKIVNLHRNTIEAEILNDINRGEKVLIPRITLQPSETNLPFILQRTQFPVIPAFAMTINKSQGQSFQHVGIQLTKPVFSHGQLYVALSRSRNPENIKIHISETSLQGKLLQRHGFLGDHQYTQNIVYREIFDD